MNPFNATSYAPALYAQSSARQIDERTPPDPDEHARRPSACERLTHLARSGARTVLEASAATASGAMNGFMVKGGITASLDGAIEGAKEGGASMFFAYVCKHPALPQAFHVASNVICGAHGTPARLFDMGLASFSWAMRFPIDWSAQQWMKNLAGDLPPGLQSLAVGAATTAATTGGFLIIPPLAGMAFLCGTVVNEAVAKPAEMAGVPFLVPRSLPGFGLSVTLVFLKAGTDFHAANLPVGEHFDPYTSQVYPANSNFYLSSGAMGQSVKTGVVAALGSMVDFLRNPASEFVPVSQAAPSPLLRSRGSNDPHHPLVKAFLNDFRAKGAAAATVPQTSALTLFPALGQRLEGIHPVSRAVLEFATTPTIGFGIATALQHHRLLGAGTDESPESLWQLAYALQLPIFICTWLVELVGWQVSKSPEFLAAINALRSNSDEFKFALTMVFAQAGLAVAADMAFNERDFSSMSSRSNSGAAVALMAACLTQAMAKGLTQFAVQDQRNSTDLATRGAAVIATSGVAAAIGGPVACAAAAGGVLLTEAVRCRAMIVEAVNSALARRAVQPQAQTEGDPASSLAPSEEPAIALSRISGEAAQDDEGEEEKYPDPSELRLRAPSSQSDSAQQLVRDYSWRESVVNIHLPVSDDEGTTQFHIP